MSTSKELPIKEADEAEILAKITKTLARLGARTELGVIRRTPGAEVLKGKRITILDDSLDVLSRYLPAIISVTEGEGDFVKYEGQTLEALVEEILAQNPNVVLLDYELSRVTNVTGADVANALRERGYAGILVGFSSMKVKDAFPADKVDGVVLKNVEDVAETLKKVSKVVGSRE